MIDKQQSETPDVTTAAPEQTPASAETPLAAEVASPTAAATDAEVAADTSGDRNSSRERPRARPRSRTSARRTAGESASHSGATVTSEPESLATRLLAPLAMPKVTIDRRLLPPKLLGALDTAGLGGADILPAATFMSLAAIGAVAGPAVRWEPVDGMPGNAGTLSLRVVLLAPDRRSPLVPAPILTAAYAAENAALDAYQQNVEQVAAMRRAAE